MIQNIKFIIVTIITFLIYIGIVKLQMFYIETSIMWFLNVTFDLFLSVILFAFVIKAYEELKCTIFEP